MPFGEVSRVIDGRAVIRSQGFAPSQRLSPTRASWPCFMPLPPIGFRPSELLPAAAAVAPLDARTLMPSGGEPPRLQGVHPPCSSSPPRGLFTPAQAAALLAFSPPRSPTTPLGRALPACAWQKPRFRVSIRCRLGSPRERDGPTPMGFLTFCADRGPSANARTQIAVRPNPHHNAGSRGFAARGPLRRHHLLRFHARVTTGAAPLMWFAAQGSDRRSVNRCTHVGATAEYDRSG